MQILIVDDDPLAGEMTAAILDEAGHVCRLAENGIEALEALADAEAGIELVVSDLNMPMLSGIDLLRELRAQGLKQPFILLSGDQADAGLLSEPGLDACLTKDFDLEESLPKLVETVAARHRQPS